MWVAKSGSIATLATGFFYYLTNFFPLWMRFSTRSPCPSDPHGGPLEFRYGQLLAMALILALAWLNYFGVKIGGDVQVAVTVVKVALIAFIIVAGLGFGTRAWRGRRPRRRAADHRGLFRRPGGRALGLRRLEQREHGGLGSPRPAAQPAALADLGNRWP